MKGVKKFLKRGLKIEPKPDCISVRQRCRNANTGGKKNGNHSEKHRVHRDEDHRQPWRKRGEDRQILFMNEE